MRAAGYRGPTPDFEWIVRRIKLGLAVAPLIALPLLPAHVQAEPPGPKTPPVLPRLPSCPSGTWTGTVEMAKKIAAKDTKIELDCPFYLDTSKVPRSKTGQPLPPYDSVPFGRASFYLDPDMTKAERQKPGKAQACVYRWVVPCPGGRPLMEQGETVVAPVRAGSEWSSAQWVDGAMPDPRVLPAGLRLRLATLWRSDAQAEHASVASFSRAALELMAVGAPPWLISAYHRAALDEVEHARIAFTVASLYHGSDIQPGPLVSVGFRQPTLTQVAFDAFVEGCLGESVAALIVHRAAVRCQWEGLSQALKSIATEEAEHAAVAWSTVEWAIRVGGNEVVDRVASVAEKLRTRDREGALSPCDPDAMAMADHGRLTLREEHQARIDAWRGIIDPTLERLLS